MPIVFIVA